MVVTDHLRIGVGEQREIDVLPAGEVLQDGLGIVADCRERYTLFLEAAFGALQLDQLPLAVGSPVRGTKEKKNGALGSFERV